MLNPWDEDEIVAPSPAAASAGGNPWDQDEIVGEAPALEIDIEGGTSVPAAQFEAQERAPVTDAKPSLFRADSDFRKEAGLSPLNMLAASARDMFGSRRGAAEYLARAAGGEVQADDRGEPVIVLPDGQAYRLNDEGLDSGDIANVAGNIAAFLTPAGWAARVGQARNMGLAGRAALQGATAGATDVALQATFDDGRVDPVRTGIAVAGGGAGEAVGTALSAVGRRGMNALNEITGRNANRAAAVLQEQGLPTTRQDVRQMAATIPELDAGANPNALIGAQRYGFRYTQGQRATDPRQQFELLSQEEVLRQSPTGGQVLRDAATHNADRLENALATLTTSVGGRPATTPAEMAGSAARRVAGQADELNTRIGQAYERASEGMRSVVSVDAVKEVPRRLMTAVADFAPNATLTPATARTLQQIRQATSRLDSVEGASVQGVTLKALETQRRIINNNINAAANPTDKRAMVTLKREFDGWLDEAVDGALVSGDPAALTALKEARALRAEFGRRFEGRGESDKFIAGLLDGSRTPEELVNIALGASQVSKAGGARFIERLRTASGNDPEVIGNLRAAHLLRLTQGANGEPLPMGQIVRNIKTTDYNNASVVRALYEPDQWREVRRLAATLEPLVAKGDFARTSGTAERMARMMFSRMGGGLPIVGDMMRGMGEVRAYIRAQRALNQPLRLPGGSPGAFPATVAGYAADQAN